MYQSTLKSIAEALGFVYHGNEAIYVTSVEIDSRLVSQDSLFVAFRGNQTDGHHYIESAIKNGARGIVCETLPKVLHPDVGYIISEGGLFLEKLASFMRAQFSGEVIAITGSFGKTSTKDLLTDLLNPYFNVVMTHENQNNELGVALTLTRLREDTDVLIVEMGMDRFGDIDYLAKLAHPTKAIITAIGTVHAEHFGSIENIAKAKMELVPYLEESSTLVLRGKDEALLLPYLKGYLGKIIWNGKEIFASQINVTREKTEFIYHEDKAEALMALPHLGEHYIENALSAIAVARALGLSLEKIAHALKTSGRKSSNRMEKYSLQFGGLLYNDSYNANPDSMKATLKVLALHKPMHTLAILGEMYELGDYEKSGHMEVGKALANEKIETLVAVGERAKWICEGALLAGMSKEAIHHFFDLHEASRWLLKHYEPNTAILLKGSRGMQMESLLNDIKEIILEGEV